MEIELGPPKQRALLELLLVRAGQPVDLSEIIDVLWGEKPPKSATNVVHRHVGALRKRVFELDGASAMLARFAVTQCDRRAVVVPRTQGARRAA